MTNALLSIFDDEKKLYFVFPRFKKSLVALNHLEMFLTLFRSVCVCVCVAEGAGSKRPYKFSPVISKNVGISPKNFMTFSFLFYHTAVKRQGY